LKAKLIALNVVLVLALGAIVWQARVSWDEAQAKRRNNLSVKVKPNPAPPLTPAPLPDAKPATNFAEIATKDLFAKDRSPTVVIDPPKVEEPKKMPPLPVVYGVLGLPSGAKAIMSEKAGLASRSVHTGDTIGEFRIDALDQRDITFDWDGKKISRKIEDLMDRSNEVAAAGAPAAAVQPSRAVPAQNNAPPVHVGPGPGGACVPGDSSPAGTVVDGYRKTAKNTPFGPMGCNWVKVQ
jgi:hypothetical protein